MELLIRNISKLIFDSNIINFLLVLAGIWAAFWWLFDNLKSAVVIVKSVLTPYFQPYENKTLVERFGKWAVITGSTDGIGKQYAKELANQGFNIFLISRTKSKLIEISKEIESMYSVKTKYIVADFGVGQNIYEEIRHELQVLDIGILVNNVGKMYEFPDQLDKISDDVIWQIINVNVGAVTLMSKIVIPQMKEKRRGIIVNISSGSECQPTPLMTVYASTKSYVKNFTLAINKELEEHNVQVQLVTPMFVQTKMNDFSTTVMKGNILIPDVETYTRSAVFTLGKTSKTTGYWTHGLQYGFMKLVPEFIRTIFSFEMNKRFRTEYFEQQEIRTC